MSLGEFVGIFFEHTFNLKNFLFRVGWGETVKTGIFKIKYSFFFSQKKSIWFSHLNRYTWKATFFH